MRGGARGRVRGARGFTLVELLLAVVLFGLLGFVTTKFVLRRMPSPARADEAVEARQGVRAAIERIATDIRVVGQGLNFYDHQVPDMIVPNDGTVGVNSYTSDAISLIAIPDPTDPSNQLALSSSVPGNGSVGDTEIAVDRAADLADLRAGERLILLDPDTGDSQVVTITGISDASIQFAADPLLFRFSATGATPSSAIKLNEVRYRTRTVSGVPFLERKVNRGDWVGLIEGITSLRFTYYDQAGEVIEPRTQAARRSIQRVEVEAEGVQLRLGSPTERRAHVRLTTSAVPRNRVP